MRSTLPARLVGSCGAVGEAVSPVVAHSIPSGPKATRQPWWRLPEPAGIPVRIGVASVSERRSSARRNRTMRTSVTVPADPWS